ncbi:ribosome biogenesis GTPase Der [Micavibrio aeruginosavorus]|uniref:ribosome biogenesis GTPase Der n=1 Tax=Micavibrio aeruginosavorus TaxID=349221 RepID=UPI003F4AE5E2
MFTLVIIGRPNVGKSTLFNRLARKQMAIIDDTPGVTRDWRETEGWLLDKKIRLIDTAGLEEAFDDSMRGKMRRQTELALAEADAVLFMVDGRSGITPMDKHFANWLRRQDIPTVLAVNKCEHENAAAAGLAEAYALGLGEPLPMSAAHGYGLDDLYHLLSPYFEEEAEVEDAAASFGPSLTDEEIDALEGNEDFDLNTLMPEIDTDTIPLRVAFVGRPNVGKSTLLNALLQEERVMTSPEAGTTRDAIAVKWTYKDRLFRLVDTAGMRRKARIDDRLEKMAVQDSLRAIRLAEVCVLVLDGNNLMEKQDLGIAEHIIDEGRALVLAINKWDAVEDKAAAMKRIEDRIEASLGQLREIPVITISALKGKNLEPMLDLVLQTHAVWNRRVPTSRMNRWLRGMEEQNPAPMANGRPNRLRYITQIKARPPTFALWVSRPGDFPDTYKRYLINGLRRDFDIPGVPVRVMIRTSKNPYVD